ncbi:AAA family ATPase, partial [Escherichia coli]|nr:AAA family ATPase [Escherichia coli]
MSKTDAPKIAHTLVISGPPGCGKTAAVYAVAKELDFEVFEINSSSRRSGKDVLEKIGDMTRNHLVQQHQSSSEKAGDDQEDATAE